MSSGYWFLLLLGASVVGPYVLGVRPRSRRDWAAIRTAIAFSLWTTLALAILRSR